MRGGDAAPDWPDPAGQLALRAHWRDQDDLHLGTGSHPGGVVWSAVCACAGEASLGDALDAAAFGYELVVRLAESLAPERARWHSTAVAGIAGAAGAAARLLGTDEVDAVAHAVSVAGGSPYALVERAGTRFVHRAHAAGGGVACARIALPASRGVLESGRGAFAALDPGMLVASRVESCLEETSFRLHAATGFAQAAIEAAQALGPLDVDVERVTVTVSPPAAVALASDPAPATDLERWWSIEHAVASALGTPELYSRVEVVAGGAGWAASVAVRLGDGSTREAAVDGPRPASDDDLLEKWRQLARHDGADVFEQLLEAPGDLPFAPLVSGALETW